MSTTTVAASPARRMAALMPPEYPRLPPVANAMTSGWLLRTLARVPSAEELSATSTRRVRSAVSARRLSSRAPIAVRLL